MTSVRLTALPLFSHAPSLHSTSSISEQFVDKTVTPRIHVSIYKMALN